MSHCGKCSSLTELAEPVKEGIGAQNPILTYALGVCSALAVTSEVDTTLTMCLSLMFVTMASTFLVSLLRNLTPFRVRMIMQMLVISTFVILVEQFLKAYAWDTSKKLSIYVTLIITNCIIMGRCEAYSMKNPPIKSALDGLGASLGYSLVLIAIALIREPLGRGTLGGFEILPASARISIAGSEAGAFIAMGIVAWAVRSIWPPSEDAPI
jgi:Na+-transporting NADH:ubiquinone oxidoreductase subunit D